MTTDENGDFSFTYRPPSGFAGTLNLWAAHPLIVDQLNQRTIEYRRFYVVPGSGRVVMSKNDSLDFQIDIVNPSNLPLENIQLSSRTYISVEGEEVDIDAIGFELRTVGPINMEPFAVRKISLRAISALNAPDEAISELIFTSTGGAAARFKAYMSLRPAVPVLSFQSPAVGYVDMSVNRGEIVSREVVLENKGLRPLEGVEIIPPAALPWMDVSLPRDNQDRIFVPDIPVGGTLRFTVAYAPPESTSLGLFNDAMLIRGSNMQGDFQVNLFAQVTSAERGSVKFFIDNIFAEAVPNAKIRLRNPNLRQELGPYFTDSLGEVTIPELQEGGWSYQVTASGHSTASDAFDISPGQTEFVTKRLSKSLVTVEFSVTPVPFTDRYEITIEQTFETRVPVPVIVMDPAMTQLFDLPDVAEGTIMIDVSNKGLASLFEVIVQGQTTPYGSFIPLITYIPELRAQETVQVPFKWTWDVRRVLGSGEGGASPSDLGSEEGLNRLAQQQEYANQLNDALSLPSTGNDTVDTCAGIFLSPFPDPRGLAALTRGLACCPDGAAMAAGATALLIGYSVATYSLTSAIASFIGCAVGGLFGGLFGGGGGGGGPGGSGPPTSGTGFGPGGSLCFIERTMVEMAGGGSKPIETIVAGDLVHTGNGQFATVDQMITRESDDLHQLTLRPLVFGDAADDVTLTGTAGHYVWTDQHGWRRIDQLEADDCLHHHDGRLFRLVKSEKLEETHPVYTLQLKDDSVFYADGFLVQHLCGEMRTGMKVAGENPPESVADAVEVQAANPPKID